MAKNKVLVYEDYGESLCVPIPVREGFSGMSRFCKVNNNCPAWAKDLVSERIIEEKMLSV